MTIILAGGTGFLGGALVARLRRDGHSVRVLTRGHGTAAREATAPGHAAVSPQGGGSATTVAWTPDGSVGAWAEAIENADALINLAGAGIADARWTNARKAVLRDSRVLSTRSLVLAIQQAAQPPAVLISASGVGYYGDRGNEVVTEDTPAGSDFLAQLCVEWEREAMAAAGTTRVAVLRNGLVMDPSGGALGKMLTPFRMGLGGPLGSGRQYLPWIHLEDWLDFVMWVINTHDARGPFNTTAPNPATNAEFTRALGRALGRPAILPVPGIGLRVTLGELADTLLTGQRAVPRRAERMGFTFRFREIAPALEDLLR